MVQLIRGPKGSQVRLEVQAGDDAPHREIVQLIESSSKSSQLKAKVEVGKKKKIGVIIIPTFYSDFTANKLVIRTTEAQPEMLKNY